MRTKQISTTPLPPPRSTPTDQWSESYEIHLLTPMIGSGTESWQIDRAQPIRASEIKHQLRFWWRTMQFSATPPNELLRKETALFGSTTGASKVRLSVTQDRPTNSQIMTVRRTDLKDNIDLPKYVLFPLVGQKDAQGPHVQAYSLLWNFSFTLKVECPGKNRPEVENSIMLWMLFGGLGARTRRGAGSLRSSVLDKQFLSPGDVLTFIRGLGLVPAAAEAPQFPILSGALLVMESIQQADPAAAWKALLGLGVDGLAKNPPGYGDLRQGRDLARSRGTVRPGRSDWPEADALRTLSGTHSPRHQPRLQPGPWYPRAAYGLPLQFQFNRNPTHGGHIDEPEGIFELLPVNYERWPSPFILKIAQIGGGLCEVAMLLNQRMPEITVKRTIKRKNPLPPTVTLHPVPANAQPEAHVSKTIPSTQKFPIPLGHPHDGLFSVLFPGVIPDDL